jgi:large repetitive protein
VSLARACGTGRPTASDHEGYVCHKAEEVIVKGSVLTVVVVAVLAVAADAPAGGISDETCPNVAGEHTNTCPAGTVGVPYSIRFRESEGSGCGPGRQTFLLDSGDLPPGLTLAPDGNLSGTSFQPGSFQFYVEMREPEHDPASCAGKRTQKKFTLKIRQQPWIVSTPAVPPRLEVGAPFRMTLRARGGSGNFAWTLAAGQLPAGVGIAVDGSIAGTPRAPGTYRFAAMAKDTEARSLIWRTKASVAPRLRIRTQKLPAARIGRAYSADLATVGGVSPTVWKLRRGRLPRGIRLAPALGRLTGVPKEAGTHLVSFEVSDGLKVRSARTFRMVVLEG